MNKRRILMLAVLLSGCALAQQAPTLRYCTEVHYNRVGPNVEITAKCVAVPADPGIPIPMPVKP